MSLVVAIGEERLLAGFALAGVDVRGAESPEAVVDAWERLGREVGLVLLTPPAEAALAERCSEREDLVWVSLPG